MKAKRERERAKDPFIPMFAALGLTARAWHNPTTAESAVLGAVTARHNGIANLLSERPDDFAPRFTAKPDSAIGRPELSVRLDPSSDIPVGRSQR